MIKPLDAHSWSQLKQNRKKFPNGTVVSEIMEAYAEYYYKEMQHIEELREKWKSEFYSKHRLLDIDFETYYKMMDSPNLKYN